jgi:uncharacterized protein
MVYRKIYTFVIVLYIFMLLKRKITSQLQNDLLKSGKVVLLYGPRQAGKTTLSKDILKELGLKALSVNADQQKYVEVLSSLDLSKLKALVTGYDVLFIDEGQRVPQIGLNLKILHDEIPELRVFVTGSSSFLLSGSVTESLAGRKKIFILLPISIQELCLHLNEFEIHQQIEERLIFGSYPEVVTKVGNKEKEEYLRDISSSLIYKDILELEQIRYPSKIHELLKLLAFQIGSQVSLHELGGQLNLNRETVERYLFLLEKSFIIFKLSAFSRNPRKEISKSQKYYFYDNGIRNIIIDNLNDLAGRNDDGALWENFIIAERQKYLLSNRINVSRYFWRTYVGNEIDYIEERSGELFAYEIKKGKGNAKIPKFWSENYGSNFEVVNADNFLSFIT